MRLEHGASEHATLICGQAEQAWTKHATLICAQAKQAGRNTRRSFAYKPGEQAALTQQIGPAMPSWVFAPKQRVILDAVVERNATPDHGRRLCCVTSIVEAPARDVGLSRRERFVLIRRPVNDHGCHRALARKGWTAAAHGHQRFDPCTGARHEVRHTAAPTVTNHVDPGSVDTILCYRSLDECIIQRQVGARFRARVPAHQVTKPWLRQSVGIQCYEGALRVLSERPVVCRILTRATSTMKANDQVRRPYPLGRHQEEPSQLTANTQLDIRCAAVVESALTALWRQCRRWR